MTMQIKKKKRIKEEYNYFAIERGRKSKREKGEGTGGGGRERRIFFLALTELLTSYKLYNIGMALPLTSEVRAET